MDSKQQYKYFLDKLKIGQIFEDASIKKVCKLFKTKLKARQTETNYKQMKYDFITEDDNTFEVKADVASLKTGNYFIEISNSTGASGLSISGATYHVLTNTDSYYLLSTDQLTELILQKQYIRRFTKDKTIGLLVPCCDINSISIDITDDTRRTTRKKVKKLVKQQNNVSNC
jgi:hypothetical protein